MNELECIVCGHHTPNPDAQEGGMVSCETCGTTYKVTQDGYTSILKLPVDMAGND